MTGIGVKTMRRPEPVTDISYESKNVLMSPVAPGDYVYEIYFAADSSWLLRRWVSAVHLSADDGREYNYRLRDNSYIVLRSEIGDRASSRSRMSDIGKRIFLTVADAVKCYPDVSLQYVKGYK